MVPCPETTSSTTWRHQAGGKKPTTAATLGVPVQATATAQVHAPQGALTQTEIREIVLALVGLPALGLAFSYICVALGCDPRLFVPLAAAATAISAVTALVIYSGGLSNRGWLRIQTGPSPPRIMLEPTNTVTCADVAKHNTKDDCWIIIEGRAFELTTWLPKHPGGVLAIVSCAGGDATDQFEAFHPEAVFRSPALVSMCRGKVVDYKPHPVAARFRTLREKVWGAGLFGRNLTYFAFRTVQVLSFYPLILWSCQQANPGGMAYPLPSLLSDSWSYTVTAALLAGIFWQQLAFFGHDLGHNGVTGNRLCDSLLGVVAGPLLTGISIGWWKKSHNTHHTVTNSVEMDPDIQHLPFFAITADFFKNVYSKYHEKFLVFDKFAMYMVRQQHMLYHVIMGFARYFLYVQSALHLVLSKDYNQFRWLECAAYISFASGVWHTFATLPTALHIFLAIVLTHNVAGILHIQITISHFAMPTYMGAHYLGDKEQTVSFVEHQLATSMDVSCSKAEDWFHGGLQFQVIHHLFPRLPRHNLRACQSMVNEFCVQENLTYHAYSFLRSNLMVLDTMRGVALAARKGQFSGPNMLWEAVNAHG